MYLSNDQPKSKQNPIVKFETDDNSNQIVDVKPIVKKPKIAVNVKSSDNFTKQIPKKERDDSNSARYSDVAGDYCVFGCHECDWHGASTDLYNHLAGGKPFEII